MKETTIFEAHDSYVLDLHFTEDSQTLISSGMDNVVKLWSVQGWEGLRTLEGHANSVSSISLSPDEKTLATGSSDQTVKLWSFPEGELLHTLQDRKKVVSAVKISPDGQWVAAASFGGRAALWTLSGEEVVGIKASKKNLNSVAFSPDCKTLVTSGLGDDILLWSLPSGEPAGSLSGPKTAVWGLTFVDGGRTMVSLDYEGTIKFWDTETWGEARTVRSDKSGVRGLLVSPDEKRMALSTESLVQLWSIGDWTLQAELPISTKVVSSMAFSPGGETLAVGGADNKIRIWELG
jgi:WD40 repeat protein